MIECHVKNSKKNQAFPACLLLSSPKMSTE
jgi:hypothetical protein